MPLLNKKTIASPQQVSTGTLVEKLLYSRDDAAIALSISVRAIDYLIAEGELPIRKMGARILIPAECLIAFSAQDHLSPLVPA